MLLPYIPPDPPAPNPSVHTIRVHPLSQSTNHHKLTSSQGERTVGAWWVFSLPGKWESDKPRVGNDAV